MSLAYNRGTTFRSTPLAGRDHGRTRRAVWLVGLALAAGSAVVNNADYRSRKRRYRYYGSAVGYALPPRLGDSGCRASDGGQDHHSNRAAGPDAPAQQAGLP